MEELLTIPKTRLVSSLAIAGIGSFACVGPAPGMLDSLLEDGIRSTGSNVAWLENALPILSRAQAEDLYIQTIQRTKSLTGELHEAGAARTDRDSLLEIKSALSLSGTQLAKAMGVSRTALYQWIEESKTMRPKSRKRLEKLRGLADQWSDKAGAPVSRSPWVSGADRARLAEMLADQSAEATGEAAALLGELAAMKPSTKRTHRSVLEISRERNWKKLPDHIRQAERDSRLPSAGGPNPDPS
jgi:transcriptional regulator with XRE-family HTH domain